jgi:hypothetical protein
MTMPILRVLVLPRKGGGGSTYLAEPLPTQQVVHRLAGILLLGTELERVHKRSEAI